VLTYYTGSQLNFDDDWRKYRLTTLPSVQFPLGFELDANGVQDVSSEFGCQQTGVRIGRATLNSGSLLFNIFANLDYRVA
jgi:hypothetical protein